MPPLYSTTDDVAARLGARPLTPTSKPSLLQVEGWLVEAEAQVTGELRAAGIGTPITDVDGVGIIKSKVVDYSVGLAKQSYGSAGGGADNDGEADLSRFQAFLDLIRKSPETVKDMLGSGTVSASSTGRFRSNFGDGCSPEPTFTRESKQ